MLDERYVSAIVLTARTARQRGLNELSAEIVDQALALRANEPEALYLRGLLEETFGRAASAQAKYTKAVAKHSDFEQAQTRLGVLLLARGEYGRAETALKRALEVASTSAHAYLNMGEAWRSQGLWRRASKAYARALALDDKLVQAHFNRGLASRAIARNSSGDACVRAWKDTAAHFKEYLRLIGAPLEGEGSSTPWGLTISFGPPEVRARGLIAEAEKSARRQAKFIERERARAKRDAERKSRAKRVAK